MGATGWQQIALPEKKKTHHPATVGSSNLAPRPGLEPGTYGLTGWPTRADAVCKAKIGKGLSVWPMAGA
jgi:hypothetical protein